MKIRLLPIATAVALSASLTTASIVPVTAQAVAKTMADKANPEFVYRGPLGVGGFHTFDLEGIPGGVTVSGVQVKGSFGYASAAFGPEVGVSIAENFGLTVSTSSRPASIDGSVKSRFDFVVTYSDGSVSKFNQEIGFTPETQEEAFDPYFENTDFNAGETTERRLSSVPKDAKISVVSEPDGWSASVVKGNLLAVTAPTEATIVDSVVWKAPQFEFSVVYPDGSSEIAEVTVVAVPVDKPKPSETSVVTSTPKPSTTSVESVPPKPSETSVVTSTPKPSTTSVESVPPKPSETSVVTSTPKPTTTSNAPASPKPSATDEESSSTGTIIAAVVAVLVVIGAGAFVALNNPQLRATLPF
ncbi:hypothetical protein ACUY2A_10245 [Corynebacterium pilbarense]